MSPLGHALRTHVTLRLLFLTRQLGGGPGVDPRIKVFAFDDQTVAGLDQLDLSLADWATVFEALDERKPAGIFIDKIFDKPYAEAEIEAFNTRVSGLSTPVNVVTFVSSAAIVGRTPLPTDRPAYDLAARSGGEGEPNAWLPTSGGHLYGARHSLMAAFRGMGHAVYDGDGFVRPLWRLGEGIAVPHWSLFAATTVSTSGGLLAVDGHTVSLDAGGAVPVNLDVRSVYSKRSISMLQLVRRAQKKKAISIVEPGDYVIILPAMYTGNTDWKETPIGAIPGGFVMVAMLNSVLSGDWMRYFDWDDAWLWLMCLLTPPLARRASPRSFWVGWVAALVGVPLVAIACFALGRVVVPWPMPLIGLLITGVWAFSDSAKIALIDKVRLGKELDTARLVQASFVQDGAFRSGDLIIDGHYQPASECGGDLWLHVSPVKGVEIFLIGDATGHGTSAALVAAMAFSAFHTAISASHSPGAVPTPADILHQMNTAMCRARGGIATMTATVFAVDTRANTLVCANAGHCRSFILGQKRRSVTTSGNFLGLFPDAKFNELRVDFRAGDRLVLYTDGLIENVNIGDEPWGQRRFQKVMDATAQQPATQIKAKIVAEAQAHFGKAPLADDLTIVIIEFTPEAASASA